MKIVILSIALVFLPIIIFIIYRTRKGHRIAVYLYRFESEYDIIFSSTNSKSTALKEALNVFRSCPTLNQLQDSDYEMIVRIIKESLDPKKIINSIVLKMDSKTSLLALKNEDLLKKMAAAGKN